MFRLWLLVLALCFSVGAVAQDVAKPYLTLEQLREKYQDRQSRYTTIGGMEVHYKDEGKGPVLLLVHGSSSTMKTWDAMAPLLRKNYRVIRYDVPGVGLSGDVPDQAVATIKPEAIAEQLLAQLGVTKVTVIGVSSGGTLGSFLAAKRPDLVERLII